MTLGSMGILFSSLMGAFGGLGTYGSPVNLHKTGHHQYPPIRSVTTQWAGGGKKPKGPAAKKGKKYHSLKARANRRKALRLK